MKTPLSTLFLASSILFASCAHQRVPVLPIPKVVSVAPEVAAVRPSVNKAANQNAEARAHVGDLVVAVSQARQEADAAMRRAGALAEAGTANKKQLDANAKDAGAMRERIVALERDAQATQRILNEQLATLFETQKALDVATVAAAQAQYAQQTFSEQLTARNTQAVADANRISKLERDLSYSNSRRNLWFWWAMGGTALIAAYLTLRVLSASGRIAARIP